MDNRREYEDRKRQTDELKEEREALQQRKRRVLEKEDEEDMELLKSYRDIDRMREACGTADVKILQLLDEKQGMLDSIRRKKTEFEEKLLEEVKKENQRIEETEAACEAEEHGEEENN